MLFVVAVKNNRRWLVKGSIVLIFRQGVNTIICFDFGEFYGIKRIRFLGFGRVLTQTTLKNGFNYCHTCTDTKIWVLSICFAYLGLVFGVRGGLTR